MKKEILVHTCCAPCLCYPYEVLKKVFKVCAFWYNPNIHGWREYNKRRMTLGYYVAKKNALDIIEQSYDVEKWFKSMNSYDEKERCRACYSIRLNMTAKEASNRKIPVFTTTLLYSRFQSFDIIIEEGRKAGQKWDVGFYEEDFRKGWKKGINYSKREKLYRQEYCGCVFSERDRYS
ncbi:MAG: epoxyqueuosine reductase QueH [Elusimicrobiota bacterium]